MPKETEVQQMMLAPPDPIQEVPKENSEGYKAGSLPASLDNAEGLTQQTYPVRWLCGRHTLSPAVAKIVAAEFGWLEVA
jgi:hypothetical protein